MRGKKPERGPLTPEQARQGRRAIRRALAAGVLQWAVVGIVIAAVYQSGSLIVIVYAALAALYLLSLPFVLRAVDRDIERRTVDATNGADAINRLARDTGLHG
jgi:hypothetical protein